MRELKNTIIYLIGVPAVGKFTTAAAIARQTGAKLVDNHLINNRTDRFPFPKDGWKYMGRIRQAVLAFIRELNGSWRIGILNRLPSVPIMTKMPETPRVK